MKPKKSYEKWSETYSTINKYVCIGQALGYICPNEKFPFCCCFLVSQFSVDFVVGKCVRFRHVYVANYWVRSTWNTWKVVLVSLFFLFLHFLIFSHSRHTDGKHIKLYKVYIWKEEKKRLRPRKTKKKKKFFCCLKDE